MFWLDFFLIFTDIYIYIYIYVCVCVFVCVCVCVLLIVKFTPAKTYFKQVCNTC